MNQVNEQNAIALINRCWIWFYIAKRFKCRAVCIANSLIARIYEWCIIIVSRDIHPIFISNYAIEVNWRSEGNGWDTIGTFEAARNAYDPPSLGEFKDSFHDFTCFLQKKGAWELQKFPLNRRCSLVSQMGSDNRRDASW